MKTQRYWIPFLVIAMLIATTLSALAAPNLLIRGNKLVRGQWNTVEFVARPKAGETLTSFSFSSELPISQIPAGCRPLNASVPVRSVTCTIQPGVMAVSLQILVQQYETKTGNSFFFRTWYRGADGSINEVNTSKIIRITNR
jgi:hypothetical protein